MNTFFEEVVEQESAQIALETEIYENMHETFSRMTQGEAEKFLENHIYYLVTRHRNTTNSYGKRLTPVDIATLFTFCSNAIQAAAKAIQTVHPQINTVAIVGKTKYKFTQDCVRKYFPEKHA
jgi:hypothetical protein